MTGHNSQNLIRSFADRIMRLKAEQDDIGHDIREVYKEAHGNGLDKTILGQLVGYLRKREKHGAIRADEQASLLQVYIDAYEESLTGTVIATRVCEPPPPHDPETGELTEPAGPALPSPEQQAGAESPGIASAPAVPDEFPDLPDFLRRKKVAA